MNTILFCSLFGALLYLMSLAMPLIGGIISFFSPLPLGYIGLKKSRNIFYICFVITCSLIFFIGGRLSFFLYLIQFGLPFLMFFELYYRNVKVITAIFAVSISIIGFTLISLLILNSMSFSAMFNMITNFLNANFEVVLKSYHNFGVKDAEIQQIRGNLKNFTFVIARILPVLMIIFYSSIFFLNLPILERLAKTKFTNFNISNWKTPFIIIWIFLICGFGIFFLKKGVIWWLLLNVFIFCCFIFLIQGFAVTEFLFTKLQFSKFMKNLLYIFILFSQILLITIAIIGLFDNWFDFRKITKSGGTNESNT